MSDTERFPIIARVPIMKVYGYVYMTICITTGKKYTGRRKRNNPNKEDSYTRSGSAVNGWGIFIREYSYMRQTKEYGFDSSSVESCCRKQYKQHKVYKFLYKEDYEEDLNYDR